jgi:hypothetical protein
VSVSGTASVAGVEFVPAYGASRVTKVGTVEVVFSDSAMNCGTLALTWPPGTGTFVSVQFASAETGPAMDPMVEFTVVSGGHVTGGGGSNQGTVEVLEVSERTITIRVTYHDTIQGIEYAVNGDFGVVRCP